MKKKIFAIIIVLILTVFLVFCIVDFSAGGFFPEAGMISYGINHHVAFAPCIYNQSTVDISLGYTPPAKTIVLYCTYTVSNSNHRVIDSSTMLHFPFSSEYIISKTLTNLPNDNYTFVINELYSNGTIHTPLNSTFTVDTTFIEPKLAIISPQTQTYNISKVDIIYHVNSKVVWSYYNLDSQDWRTWTPFSGNITLDGLSEGLHQIAISVKTEANEHTENPFETQTISFNINTPEIK